MEPKRQCRNQLPDRLPRPQAHRPVTVELPPQQVCDLNPDRHGYRNPFQIHEQVDCTAGAAAAFYPNSSADGAPPPEQALGQLWVGTQRHRRGRRRAGSGVRSTDGWMVGVGEDGEGSSGAVGSA